MELGCEVMKSSGETKSVPVLAQAGGERGGADSGRRDFPISTATHFPPADAASKIGGKAIESCAKAQLSC